MRRFLAGVVTAVLAAVAWPAQAAEHTGTIVAPYADWAGVGFNAGTGHASATLQGFLSACATDFMLGGEDARAAFLASPLNGYDAYVVDLGREVSGAFSVRGPGPQPVGEPIPTGGTVFDNDMQLTSYDLDLDFYTDVENACADANFVDNADNQCFSNKPDPDESTPCIVGYTATDGVVHGARYVVVVAALNLTGGPLDFTLIAP